MLHCFDAATLEELWAFIPNNLLWKLKKMRIVDPDCGEYLSHEFFIDGTPEIHDVYFGGSWHTVLVCGQASGWGRNNKCYYFALDITNPLNPLPLWEFTDTLTTGETYSVPAIGRVESTGRWYAFVGSGYDNDTVEVVGHTFYALDIERACPPRPWSLK
jgi:Tfp pilus tip-associated adhesin PilY1